MVLVGPNRTSRATRSWRLSYEMLWIAAATSGATLSIGLILPSRVVNYKETFVLAKELLDRNPPFESRAATQKAQLELFRHLIKRARSIANGN